MPSAAEIHRINEALIRKARQNTCAQEGLGICDEQGEKIRREEEDKKLEIKIEACRDQ